MSEVQGSDAERRTLPDERSYADPRDTQVSIPKFDVGDTVWYNAGKERAAATVEKRTLENQKYFYEVKYRDEKNGPPYEKVKKVTQGELTPR